MNSLPVLRDVFQPGSRAREQARRLGRLLARIRRPDVRDPWRPDATPVTRLPSQHDLLPTALASLALRDLTLVEQLLTLVEQLEEKEENPEQLDVLYRIDHLATRMRRNGENLLVLAGQDTGHDRQGAVRLLDVARAAVSEITDYQRADVTGVPDVRVAGIAADDISHLLAELLDNATSKSPQHTQVVVSARVIADGTVVVSVEDSGIGIPVQRMAELNARLEGPPVLDVAITRHMGLYVVGRLAHRHGIRVQLQTRPFGGTTAYAVLPSHLVHMEAATRATATADSPVSRPGAQDTPAQASASARTATSAGTSGTGRPSAAPAPVSPPSMPTGEPGRTTPAGLPKRLPGASVGFMTATGMSHESATAPQVAASTPDQSTPSGQPTSPDEPISSRHPTPPNDGEPGFIHDTPRDPAERAQTEPAQTEPADSTADEPHDPTEQAETETIRDDGDADDGDAQDTDTSSETAAERESWGVQEPAGVRAPEHTDPFLAMGLTTAERIRDDLGGFQAGQREARENATSFRNASDVDETERPSS